MNYLLAGITLLVAVAHVQAHSGRTRESDGCHNDTSAHEEHCHNGDGSTSKKPTSLQPKINDNKSLPNKSKQNAVKREPLILRDNQLMVRMIISSSIRNVVDINGQLISEGGEIDNTGFIVEKILRDRISVRTEHGSHILMVSSDVQEIIDQTYIPTPYIAVPEHSESKPKIPQKKINAPTKIDTISQIKTGTEATLNGLNNRWLATYGTLSGPVTLVESQGKLALKMVFNDGSTLDLRVRKTKLDNRTMLIPINEPDEFYVINENGDLEFWHREEGRFHTAKKVI